jgi:hypothetical protein
MRAEKVVSFLLNDDAAVAAIVEQKIFGGVARKGAVAPLVVYALQSSSSSPDLSATAAIVDAFVDVLMVARTYAELKELSEAVRIAVSYKYGTVAGVEMVETQPGDAGPDEYDADLDEHAQVRTFLVKFVE